MTIYVLNFVLIKFKKENIQFTAKYKYRVYLFNQQFEQLV